MKFNVLNMIIFGLAGATISYAITINDLQAGSMTVGAITGILALYAQAMNDYYS